MSSEIEHSIKWRWMVRVWGLSTLIMFGLSYLWHGVLLNDYVNIKYPLWLHLMLAGVVYLVIAFVLTYLHQYTTVRHHKFKGLLLGSILGFFIYLIAFVLGVSYNPHSIEHTVVDFIWQMVEQGLGGMTIGFAFRVLEDNERLSRVS